MTEVETGPQGAGDIVLGCLDGFAQRPACSKIAGNGAGKRAACAVGVFVSDTFGFEPLQTACLTQQVIGTAGEMAAFDEYSTEKMRSKLLACEQHIGIRTDPAAGEYLCLRDIRRDDAGKRQKMGLQSCHGIRGEQAAAARGDHDRVNDNVFGLVFTQLGGDDLDDWCLGNHADLYGIWPDVLEDAVELIGNEFRRSIQNGFDAEGVLRGK